VLAIYNSSELVYNRLNSEGKKVYIMKYISAALIVLGLGIVLGAETHDWFPMFAAQVALGTVTLISGGLFATLIKTEED